MRKKKNIWLYRIFMCLLVLIGLGLMLYPAVAAWYGDRVSSEVMIDYINDIDNTGIDKINDALNAAHKWNHGLSTGSFDVLQPDENGYFSQLNLAGNGVMGWIEIPKIHVRLPIYHGVGDNALKSGVGHLPPTSLPVGGESTHAVLSAHSGASQKLFSDLPLLETGDVFFVRVLNQEIWYEVDQIKTVLPTQIDDLQIIPGEDHMTLITCTPYGVNTHRLLVRGKRIDEPPAQAPVDSAVEADKGDSKKPESVWLRNYVLALIIGIVLPLILLLSIVIKRRKKNA